MIQPALL
jgi:protein transport protein SEC23